MAKREIIVELQFQDGDAVNKLGRLEIETKQYQRELKLLNAEIVKNGAATAEQTRRVGELNAMIRRNQGEVRELKNDLSGLTAAGLRFRDKMAQASTQALQAFGLNVLSVTGAVTAAIGVFSDAARTVAEFDKALSSIRALGGEYAWRINEIAEVAKTAGINFGFTATETLGAVEALAKAGVTTADILGGSLQGALTLAAAGQLSVADAAETASKAMTQFGLAGADIPHLADLLAAGAASATGEVTDFAQALNQSGLVASQAGISIEETVGTLTAFASAGLLGSDAGTSFRTMLLRLQNPSKESADQMKALGLNAFNAQGEFIGLEALAGQLQERLSGLTEEQRSAALAQIFGTDAVRAANVLYTQGAAGIAEYTKQVNQSGFASRVAQEQTDNLSGAIDRAKGAWDAFVLSIDSGSGIIARAMRAVIDAATGIFLLLSDPTDALGRNVGTGQGSALRNEQSIEAFRNQINELLKASDRLAQSENTDRIVAKYRDQIRVALERADTLEKTIALEAQLNERLSQTAEGSVKYAATQVQLKFVQDQIKAQRAAQVAEAPKVVETQQQETQVIEEKTDAVVKLTEVEKKRLELQKEMREIAQQDAERMGVRTGEVGAPLPEAELQSNEDYINATLEAYAIEQAAFESLQQAKIDAVQAFGSILSAVADDSSNAAKVGLAIEKAAAVARVIVNLQSELSAINANVPNTVASPDFGVTAKSVARIAAITRAAASIGVITAQTVAGFAEGGYTSKKASNHEAVGVVHANEWVAPAWMVKSPAFAPILGQLEDFRKMRGLTSMTDGFFLGGRTTRGTALVNSRRAPDVPGAVITSADLARAIRGINMQPVVRVTDIIDTMGSVVRVNQASAL